MTTTLSLLDLAPRLTPFERMERENVARCRKKNPVCYHPGMLGSTARVTRTDKRLADLAALTGDPTYALFTKAD
jgi:hypothetical protein